jgi:hypothetical protein
MTSAVVLLSTGIVGSGITPNYSCGCGEIENGTKLTRLIDGVSKNIVGNPVFKAQKSAENNR